MSTRRPPLEIALRTIGAVGGGYALAVAISVALARALPGAASEAVVIALIAGALAMPAAAIWMFGAGTARRAWGWLALAIGLSTLVAMLGGMPA